MKKSKFIKLALLALMVYCLPRFVNAQDKEAEKLITESNKAKAAFIKTDPSMATLFESSYGYFIFPKIGKGGLIVGGSGGNGILYEKGKAVGMVKTGQVTVGAQATQVQGDDAGVVEGAWLHVASAEHGLRRYELRQLIERGFHRGGAGVLEHLVADRDDRAGRLEVTAHDARTGDGDFLEVRCGRLFRGPCGRRMDGNTAENCGYCRADRHALKSLLLH